MEDGRKRVAVLGGGMESLSAVYWLTARPGWSGRYEITVYQMGWHLGGEGASSRNASRNLRSEEHGYHVLLGYEGARTCGTRPLVGRPATQPGGVRPRA